MNSVPLTFRSAPLPDDYSATPEQFKNDIVARLYAETADSISFFVSGSVAPTSNVGPWLKDGVEWWVWDDGTGAYVPLQINQLSLKYIAQQAEPDPDDYIFWIELDGMGKAIAIKYYSDGAWKDVYEDKFAEYYTITQTDAAIANAIDAIQSYPAQAVTGVYGHTLPCTNVAEKIEFSVTSINPAPGPFNTANSRYIAPVSGYYQVSVSSQIDNINGTAASMEVGLSLYKNGSFYGSAMADLDSGNIPTQRWSPGFAGLVPLNQGDYIEIWGFANDTVGTGTVNVTVAQFSIFKIT